MSNYLSKQEKIDFLLKSFLKEEDYNRWVLDGEREKSFYSIKKLLSLYFNDEKKFLINLENEFNVQMLFHENFYKIDPNNNWSGNSYDDDYGGDIEENYSYYFEPVKLESFKYKELFLFCFLLEFKHEVPQEQFEKLIIFLCKTNSAKSFFYLASMVDEDFLLKNLENFNDFLFDKKIDKNIKFKKEKVAFIKSFLWNSFDNLNFANHINKNSFLFCDLGESKSLINDLSLFFNKMRLGDFLSLFLLEKNKEIIKEAGLIKHTIDKINNYYSLFRNDNFNIDFNLIAKPIVENSMIDFKKIFLDNNYKFKNVDLNFVFKKDKKNQESSWFDDELSKNNLDVESIKKMFFDNIYNIVSGNVLSVCRPSRESFKDIPVFFLEEKSISNIIDSIDKNFKNKNINIEEDLERLKKSLFFISSLKTNKYDYSSFSSFNEEDKTKIMSYIFNGFFFFSEMEGDIQMFSEEKEFNVLRNNIFRFTCSILKDKKNLSFCDFNKSISVFYNLLENEKGCLNSIKKTLYDIHKVYEDIFKHDENLLIDLKKSQSLYLSESNEYEQKNFEVKEQFLKVFLDLPFHNYFLNFAKKSQNLNFKLEILTDELINFLNSKLSMFYNDKERKEMEEKSKLFEISKFIKEEEIPIELFFEKFIEKTENQGLFFCFKSGFIKEVKRFISEGFFKFDRESSIISSNSQLESSEQKIQMLEHVFRQDCARILAFNNIFKYYNIGIESVIEKVSEKTRNDLSENIDKNIKFIKNFKVKIEDNQKGFTVKRKGSVSLFSKSDREAEDLTNKLEALCLNWISIKKENVLDLNKNIDKKHLRF